MKKLKIREKMGAKFPDGPGEIAEGIDIIFSISNN